jgi:hypothetical protein
MVVCTIVCCKVLIVWLAAAAAAGAVCHLNAGVCSIAIATFLSLQRTALSALRDAAGQGRDRLRQGFQVAGWLSRPSTSLVGRVLTILFTPFSFPCHSFGHLLHLSCICHCVGVLPGRLA